VEKLALNHTDIYNYQQAHGIFATEDTEWRKFLRPFNNVKSLNVSRDLVRPFSHSLRLEDEDEEPPQELLSNLEVLICSGRDHDIREAFINQRQDAGHPVRLNSRS
jgi:hypothetical protein